jgi:hydroxylamine reductase (hybrid-cluster protein)
VASLVTGRKTTLNGLAWIGLATAIGLGGVACNSVEKKADEVSSIPSADTVTAAREAQASNVVEVNFDKNSFVLSEGHRSALANMINQVKAQGQIEDVKVLAWADAAYPADAKKTLSKADRELAKKRADAISNFIRSELAVSDVDTLNMAERSGAISNFFNTEDARLKRSMENAGVTSNDANSLTGKVSRAVVMVITK